METVRPSGSQWEIAADGHRAVVVEVGGGLRAYDVDREPVIDGYAESELCPGTAGQVLAPWPNRIRDGRYSVDGIARQLPLTEPERHNAIHGLVTWQRWSCVSQAASSVTVECATVPQPGYPWPLLLRTVWTVGADGLTAEHSATNLGASSAPFGLGAHPYVRLPGVSSVDDAVLCVPARSRLLLDARLLPIGVALVAESEFDFTKPRRIGSAALNVSFGGVELDVSGRSTVRVTTVDGSATVEVWADESFRWWQVFSGDTLGDERARRAVAVEPMTCPPDAFRSHRDVVTLKPGETWHGTWGISPKLREG